MFVETGLPRERTSGTSRFGSDGRFARKVSQRKSKPYLACRATYNKVHLSMGVF